MKSTIAITKKVTQIRKTKKESDIKTEVLSFLKKNYPSGAFWVIHKTLYGAGGISDIIGIMEGRFIAIEVKRPGKQPTERQKEFLSSVRKKGGVSCVVDSVEVTRIIMDDHFRSTERGK